MTEPMTEERLDAARGRARRAGRLRRSERGLMRAAEQEAEFQAWLSKQTKEW